MKSVYAALMAALFTGEVLAQSSITTVQTSKLRDQPEQTPPQAVTELDPSELESGATLSQKASTFLGMAVQNPEGKPVGKVQDMVFNLDEAKIGYIVVALDSPTSGQPRFVPVPVSAIKPLPGGEHLVLNLSDTVLAAASSVNVEDLPPYDIFAVGGPAEVESGAASSSDVAPSEPTPREPPTEIETQSQEQPLAPEPK